MSRRKKFLSALVSSGSAKIPVEKTGLYVKPYEVLCDCIERGIGFGIRRAYKYSDKPTEESFKEEIYREVLNAIFEYFDFIEPNDKQ